MAVVIFLSLLLLPVMAVLVRALMLSNEVEYLTVATFLAVEKVEETRARATCYTDAAAGCPLSGNADDFDQDFDQGDAADPDPECTFPPPYDNYECTVDYTVVNALGNANNRLAEIQVRVWYDKNGDSAFDESNEPDVYLETMIAMHQPAW